MSKDYDTITLSHNLTLDELKKEYILYVLDTHNGDIKATAKHLDVSQKMIYNALHKWGQAANFLGKTKKGRKPKEDKGWSPEEPALSSESGGQG